MPPALSRRIISIQHLSLLTSFISRAESVPALFAHPLNLPHFPDRLLELFHPRPIVLNVIFLYLLNVVVCLREIHALGVLPGDVAEQAGGRKDEGEGVEDGRGEHDGDNAGEFDREAAADLRGDGGVDRDKNQPDDQGAGDGEDGPFRPYVRDQCRFEEHDAENGCVEAGAPEPVTADLAVAQDEVVVKEV